LLERLHGETGLACVRLTQNEDTAFSSFPLGTRILEGLDGTVIELLDRRDDIGKCCSSGVTEPEALQV
jgi:hypothetical protein